MVEVSEVHVFLLVEQGQVDNVAVVSPRAKLYVALLLILEKGTTLELKIIFSPLVLPYKRS